MKTEHIIMIVVVVAVIGYGFYAHSKSLWPFN